MKPRPYNFGAGPATLPESILLDVQAELLNWQGSGMSILEVGHRTPEFIALMDQAEVDLRDLLAIPDNYQVLFLGGAARTQFAMIPMNLIAKGNKAGYLISGIWSKLAFEEACHLKSAYCIASSEQTGFTQTPVIPVREGSHRQHGNQTSLAMTIAENTAYVYYTPNETVNGVRFANPPKTGDVPLIADMTSCLLSEPLNITDFGLIFAGTQKNISPAGLTIVIIRDDLLEQQQALPIPSMMSYRIQADNKSRYATPPVFNCYFAAKMFQWVKACGGVEALYQINCQKAAKLYQYIDTSSFYQCRVEKHSRSLMNVCFSLEKPALESVFLSGAKAHGLYALQGHRLVGGLRASLYNALPMAGVEALIAFMQQFAEEHQ